MTQITTMVGAAATPNTDRFNALVGESFSARRALLIAQVEGADGPSVILEIIHSFPSGVEAVEAIRKFLQAWRCTSEGAHAWADSMADFNWGDVALHAEVLAPLIEGIIQLKALDQVCLVINHDEPLMEAT